MDLVKGLMAVCRWRATQRRSEAPGELCTFYRLGGGATRPGLLKCRDCKGQFSVTVDTVMEDTHLPLSLWAKAFHMMASSKGGISALQMQRQLSIGSYRTAWHLCQRIRTQWNRTSSRECSKAKSKSIKPTSAENCVSTGQRQRDIPIFQHFWLSWVVRGRAG